MKVVYAKGPSGPGFHITRYIHDVSETAAKEAERQYYQSFAFEEKIQYFMDSTDIYEVRRNGLHLKRVKKQTPEICLAAVQNFGDALEFVLEQTPEICLAAVQNFGDALRFVKEQTPEICLAAVKSRARRSIVLQFVINQTPEICLAAVQENGLSLEFVINQTPEICLAAVQQNGKALMSVVEQTPEICLAAVQQWGGALEFIDDWTQTSEVCLAAVKQWGGALRYVAEQTPEICLAAVNWRNPYRFDVCHKYILKYVREQTPEICLAAVQYDGLALEFVREQTYEICLVAVQRNEDAIYLVRDTEVKDKIIWTMETKPEARRRIALIKEELIAVTAQPDYHFRYCRDEEEKTEDVFTREELRTPKEILSEGKAAGKSEAEIEAELKECMFFEPNFRLFNPRPLKKQEPSC
jgi:hypothetical protein